MRNNFIEILNNKVEIPIIQRDYAQGRTDNKTNKIRKDFLDVLFDFINHKNSQSYKVEIELDFIYGFNEQDTTNKSTFIPIDGQQRLTTLWLLYWFVSVKEKIVEADKSFLFNFLYETRHSTSEFCKKLIHFKPSFSDNCITEEIKNQAWYFEIWDYDPSIQAMLVVLDDIEVRYGNLNIVSVWRLIEGTECPFHFYKLDMNKVGLTDDLYIKMNSRGKALTEFEYFKAGFSEIIIHPKQKERFEKSIDGEWIDCIWNIVFESKNFTNDDDIASKVDNSFLNLFNFITSIIAFQKDIKTDKGIRYKDTVNSSALLKVIYSDETNQNALFDTLDSIYKQQVNDPLFWDNTFYFTKVDFSPSKTRLFFQHKEVNLLKRCLFHFSEYRGFSYPEQLLLYACFIQLKTHGSDFENKIRTIRNLAVNSENELRETILGYSFNEIENYIIKGEINTFKNFKTDQIDEEKSKIQFLQKSIAERIIVNLLEDSDIMRGSISLFPLENNFENRAFMFLELFNDDEIIENFINKCNLLLCFGDYSQDDGSLTNLMSPSKAIIRSFFTTPGYNKKQFYTKTQLVVMKCLDFFISNQTITEKERIENTLSGYNAKSKDWKYYFIKYPSFWKNCTRGYYWFNGDYCIWKMRVKQFNGYHWDPFLYEVRQSTNSEYLYLDNFEAKLLFTFNRKKIFISSISSGFLFENGMSTPSNSLLENLINNGVISSDGELIISQNSEGFDLEDRIVKLNLILTEIAS